jgi:hypothetical protein
LLPFKLLQGSLFPRYLDPDVCDHHVTVTGQERIPHPDSSPEGQPVLIREGTGIAGRMRVAVAEEVVAAAVRSIRHARVRSHLAIHRGQVHMTHREGVSRAVAVHAVGELLATDPFLDVPVEESQVVRSPRADPNDAGARLHRHRGTGTQRSVNHQNADQYPHLVEQPVNRPTDPLEHDALLT